MTKDEYEVYERVREQRDELRNALLEVEWTGGHETGVDSGCESCCPCCDVEPEIFGGKCFSHTVDCKLDAALTKAGLPDQASRDAARKELGL